MMRNATPEDTSEMVTLTAATGVFKASEVEVLQELLDQFHAGEVGEHHIVQVCEHDGKLVGFAYYAPDVMTDASWYLYWIAVNPGTQGKGIGSEILRSVEQDVRARGGRLFFIETSSLPTYEPTRRFYLKHGYEVTATLRDFYTDGDDMVIFRKRLRGQDR